VHEYGIMTQVMMPSFRIYYILFSASDGNQNYCTGNLSTVLPTQDMMYVHSVLNNTYIVVMEYGPEIWNMDHKEFV
jgi:hypothetical protein